MLEEMKEFAIYVSLAHISPKTDLVNPNFLLYYINSKFAKVQFNKDLIWIWVPNLHLSKIRETKIPLPNIDEQINIVNNIKNIEKESEKLRNEAEFLLKNSMVHFEKQIFNS